MGTRVIRQLQDAALVVAEYPVTQEHRIAEHRQAFQRVLAGEDPRLLVEVGPCSAYPSDAVKRYAEKLSALQEDLHDQLLIVMRCYTQKPRTTTGWTGPMQEPNPLTGVVDIPEGIRQCRALMHSIGKMLPLMDEMLYTNNAPYVADLLSSVGVGARSTENQQHRQVASGLDMAVGMKNPTSGSIAIGVNSVVAAQASHEFPYGNQQVLTTGNPYAHLVLRGGEKGGNYDPHSIATAHRLLMKQVEEKRIQHPAIVVDCSHDNSMNGHGKDPDLQLDVVDSILRNMGRKRHEYDIVRGFMLESFLKRGNQKVSKGMDPAAMDLDGLSITDPCLGWDQTEELLRRIADVHARTR